MRKKRRLFWVLLAAAAALLTLFTCESLETEDWEVSSPRLPAAFDGLRVTLLTDVHGRTFGKNSEKILEAVKNSKPNLIAISGDLADEVTDRKMLDPLLKGLCAIAPAYYVTGNHEWRRPDREEVLDQIANCGVTVLRNGFVTLARDGQTILLAGAEDPNGFRDMETPEALMGRVRAGGDPYVAVLYHRNDALDLWSGLEADLVLSGHGHGGVVRLPFIGGLLGVDRRFFPKNAEGLYTQGRTTMAVSRGLGGIRLWNRPHVPTIVLRCENP